MKQRPRETTEWASAVDGASPVPLWRQLFLVLRESIYDGSVAGGDLLPGEIELARRFGVSTITAKRALNELARARLVVRRQGDGTRVLLQPQTAPIEASISSALETARVLGRSKVQVISMHNLVPPPWVSEALDVEAGTELGCVERVRLFGNLPFAFVTTYLPPELMQLMTASELEEAPLVSLLARHGHTLRDSEQTISATLADTRMSQYLDLDVGAPLLRVQGVARGKSGKPVQCYISLYRPDRFTFSIRYNPPIGNSEA